MALTYVSIILSLYVCGMVMLYLHYVKQKHGQLTLYDLYLEVMPERWTRQQQQLPAEDDVEAAAAAAETKKKKKRKQKVLGPEDEELDENGEIVEEEMEELIQVRESDY